MAALVFFTWRMLHGYDPEILIPGMQLLQDKAHLIVLAFWNPSFVALLVMCACMLYTLVDISLFSCIDARGAGNDDIDIAPQFCRQPPALLVQVQPNPDLVNPHIVIHGTRFYDGWRLWVPHWWNARSLSRLHRLCDLVQVAVVVIGLPGICALTVL